MDALEPLTNDRWRAGFIVDAIGRWERELYPWIESRRPDVFSTIRAKANDSKAFNELTELMKSALTEYNKEFQVEKKAG